MKKLIIILLLAPFGVFSQSKINPNQIPAIPYNISPSINAYGDSYTLSGGASNTQQGYIYLMQRYFGGIPLNNYALSGSGIFYSAQQSYVHDGPGVLSLSTLSCGFNDLGFAGGGALTLSKIVNGTTAIFVNHNMDSVAMAGASSARIVETGSWTNTYNAAADGGKSSTGATTTANGATITYTFYNDNVVLGLIGTDGTIATNGTATILIDGLSPSHDATINENSQTDGVTDINSNNNAHISYVRIYTGLGQRTHTIKITTTSTNTFAVDYFGMLRQPQNCKPFIVWEIAKRDSAGYTVGPGSHSSNAITDSANAHLEREIKTWPSGYPVYVAYTNSFYNPILYHYTDNVHPNDQGHRQIYQAGYAALVNVFNAYPLNNLTFASGGGISSFIYDGTVQVKLKIDTTYVPIMTGIWKFKANTTPVQIIGNSGAASAINFSRTGFANWYIGSANNSTSVNISNDVTFATNQLNITTNGLGIYGTPTANFQVSQPTTGLGTVTNTAGGTTVTGSGTLFTNTFKIGDAITISGETQTISAIASGTSMTTGTWTNAHTSLAYTLTGGTRLQVFGNGNINAPILTASKVMFTDASKNLTSTGIGTSTQGIAGDGSLYSLNSKPHTIFTPTTGGTVSLTNNQYNIINPAGALLALTVNLPSSPANNDCVFIKFTQNVTTVTYGNGTVVDGITAPTAGGLTVLTYDSGTTSWY